MAGKKTTTSAGKSAGRTRSRRARNTDAMNRAELKKHYRTFIEPGPDGRRYNPVLDEPKSKERNVLGLTHSTRRGYDIGQCQCPPCTQANTHHSAEQEQKKIERARQSHALTLALHLRAAFPGLAEEQYQAGGAAAVRTGVIRNKREATFTYTIEGIDSGLRNWIADTPSVTPPPDGDLLALATQLREELSSP